MGAWVVWMVLAAVLAVVEMFTITFGFALLAVAAALAGIVAAVGVPVVGQAAVFAAASAAGLVLLRPVVQRHISQPPPLRSGTAALVGREALTLTEVTKYAGRVRIGGEEWTARPYAPDVVIPAGAAVDVLEIEGATALVHPHDENVFPPGAR